MSYQGATSALPVAVLVMLAALLGVTTVPGTSADCEQELAQVRDELNETKDQLAEVTDERDRFADRLYDQTVILIVVLFLLVGSYFLFFLTIRRQRLYLVELEKRLGVEVLPRRQPRRRRRG